MKTLCFDKKFFIFFAILATIFALASLYYYHKSVQSDMSITWVDFRVYYDACLRLASGSNLYDLNDGYFIYKYSPVFALGMTTIRALVSEPSQALCVWYIALFVAFLISAYLIKEVAFGITNAPPFRLMDMAPFLFVFRYLILVNLIPVSIGEWPVFVRIFDIFLLYAVAPLYFAGLFFTLKGRRDGDFAIIMPIAALFILKSLILNINRAQVNILILLLLLFFSYYLMRKKDIAAGIYLGVAAVIKLVPVIFVVYLVIKKKFKALIASIATFFIFLFIPSLKWGIEGNIGLLRDWKGMLGMTLPSEYLQHKNQSMMAMISRFFSENSEIALLKLNQAFLTGTIFFVYTCFIFLLIYCVMRKRRRHSWEGDLLDLSLFFTAMTILSPVGTKTTFVYLFLPFTLLIKEVFRRGLRDKILNVVLILYLVQIYVNSSDVIGDFSITAHNYSITTFFNILVFFLLIYVKLWSTPQREVT